MASGNISSGDEREPSNDPNKTKCDVPTSNRKINDNLEANDDQKVILEKGVPQEPEVTNSTRDSDEVYNSIDKSKLDPPRQGENNANGTEKNQPDLPAREGSQTPPMLLRPLPFFIVPGTIYTKSNTTSENCQHILIQGIPEFMSVEDIAKHIETDIIDVENSIDTLKVNRIDKEVVVTLKQVKVTKLLERVASGENITLGNDEVDVKLYEQPPTDPTKAFISGLDSATTSEDICLYLEKKCGSRPVSVLMGEIPGTAMICLQNATDLSRIQKAYFWLSPEEKNGFISGVERSRKICVKAVAMDTTPETLKNYFENKETSLGGITESIIFRSNSKDYIVTFKSIEDAENVVRKGNHMIGEVKLEVSSFHPCLYLSEETFTPKPSPIVLYTLNTYMCRFLQHSKRYRTDLEDTVKQHHGRIIWPPENCDDCLQIEYDVCERDRAAKEKIQDCCQNSASAVSQVCHMLSVQYMNCAHEILEDLKTEFNRMKVPDTDAINIYNRKDLVVIAGETKHVDDISEKVKKLISTMEQTLDSMGKQITKMLKLSRHEVELLPSTKLTESLTDVQFTIDKQNMIFKGKKKMVDDALLKVKEKLRDFPKKNIEGIGVTARKLLRKSDAREFIEERIKNANVQGVLELLQDQTLVLYSITEDQLKSATKILQSSLKTGQIKLDLDARNIVLGKEGKRYLADLELKYKGILQTDVYRDELCIVSYHTFYNEINEKIMKYIDSKSYITELLPLEQGVFYYLLMYKKRELVDIEQQFKGLCVEVDIIDKNTRKGFTVSGPKDHCKLAIVAINAITNTVDRTDQAITCPLFDKFLGSPEGTEEIEKIELSEQCVLTFSTGNPISPVSEKRSSSLASCKIGICEIKIVEGDITDADVEYIVCPADITLEHKRGLGRTLVDKGGFSIQKNCYDYKEQTPTLTYGDVFIGDAGHLQFKGIIHMVLPDWNGGCKNVESILQHAVTKCLSEADDNKASSIAFPPVGTGQFGYPNRNVARILIRSIKDYLVNNGTDTLLRQVYVYDLDGIMSPFFVEMIEKGFRHTVIYPMGKLQRGQTDSTEHKRVAGISIEAVTGSLVSQDVDVIVNSTNFNFDLRVGNVSRQILKEGGDQIAEECQKNLFLGEVAETTAGNLKCKAIFHGVLVPRKEGSQDYAETVLTNVVRKCLILADKKQYSSIAFPLLGTGALGFPEEVVSDLIFNTIKAYGGDTSNSSLETVRIVISPDEKSSIKEFEDRTSQAYSQKRLSRTASVVSSCLCSKVFIERGNDFTATIGHVTLRIEHGDLTKSTTSVIVNSVGENLNLNSGKISEAILKAAGMSIQHEATDNKSIFKEEGLVMTNSGQLLCQKIIHLKAKSSLKGWKKAIGKCLAAAEKAALNSVSFPALGTGGKGFTPDDIAKTMIEAIKEYVNGNSFKGFLKSVSIFVYEKKMVDRFVKEVKRLNNEPNRKTKRSSWRKRLNHKSDENCETNTVVHIYSESPSTAENVVKSLDCLQRRIRDTLE